MLRIVLAWLLLNLWVVHAQSESLLATFRSQADPAATDPVILPNVWLFVPHQAPPTPFLTGGPFEVEWSGAVSVDLRGEYAFQAELTGEVLVKINGETVLDAASSGTNTPPGKVVRLNKGKNSLAVSYKSPVTGGARLRLLWIPKGSFAVPLPGAALSYVATPESKRGEELRLGRELFVEYRCARCHEERLNGMPELEMDAPSFENIGSRRQSAWLSRWILNPKQLRPSAHMPVLFSGLGAKEKAEAVTTYLSSLGALPQTEEKQSDPEDLAHGKRLFEGLHCLACHSPPHTQENRTSLVPLRHISEKFSSKSLVEFLLEPSAHYKWIRMPQFKWTNQEPAHLAEYLLSIAPKFTAEMAEPKKNLVSTGKELVASSGCFACHAPNQPSNFKKPARLASILSDKGCLASEPQGSSPFFGFTTTEKAALKAFAATDRKSLSRHVPSEFAARQTRSLSCAECHGKFEGFPAFELLGEKLKPEWSKDFISGKTPYRPRPWLEARMPAFQVRAEALAEGLAMLHGYPPKTPDEPPIDAEAVKNGQILVGANGGFSCIMCHAVGEQGATQVFESAGINFAYSGERLLKPYFERWLRNPLAIDPATKMPVYFQEDGQSPLPDIYGGDGLKQIEAIWHYIRLGSKMPPAPSN